MSYFHENLTSSEEMSVSVRLWAEDRQLYSSLGAGSSAGGIVASRAEVMRTLAEVEMIMKCLKCLSLEAAGGQGATERCGIMSLFKVMYLWERSSGHD